MATSPHARDAEPPIPSAAERGTRRTLWISLVSLVATVLLVDVGFRSSTIGQRFAAENLYVIKAEAYSRSDGYDVVIAGDSRVMHGVDPRVVESVLRETVGRPLSVWNAGLSGAPPMAELGWVERALSHSHRPRVVVLAVSPNAFGTLLPDPPSREAIASMFRLQDIPTVWRAGASTEDLATIASANLLSVMRYRTRMLAVLVHGEGFGPEMNAGIAGYGPMYGVDPALQDVRARHRLVGYAHEMNGAAARFGNEQMGYFRMSLARLRSAGIYTVVLNSPSATQLDAAYGPGSLYDRYLAFVQSETRAAGAHWLDGRHIPGMNDALFVDGDHMSIEGAARFSEWLARTALVPALRDGAR